MIHTWNNSDAEDSVANNADPSQDDDTDIGIGKLDTLVLDMCKPLYNTGATVNTEPQRFVI